MIIWILESESGIKLLYKSFLKTEADEDIVSGFLSAFHQFSMVEFKEALESLEMGGLRWIYILDPAYHLLFVAADTKDVKTEILMGRLNAIKNAFVEEFKSVWLNREKSWDGNVNVFLPFLDVVEAYYKQWAEVEAINQVADFFDILGIFQQILIMLRNILDNKMYSKSKINVLSQIEEQYLSLIKQSRFENEPDLENISFSKELWFDIIDINLIKCDQELVIKYLKSIVTLIIDSLAEIKGKNSCFKYFHDEGIYAYIYNNMQMLKDLNMDRFVLEKFLIL